MTEFMHMDPNASDSSNDNFNEFKKVGKKLLRKWYVLVIVLALSIGVAYYYTKSTVPVYNVEASVLVKDPKNLNNTIADLLYKEDMLEQSNNLENIALLIKKFDIVQKTITELDLETFFYTEERFRKEPLYKNSPINVNIINRDGRFPDGVLFKCTILDSGAFKLETNDEIYEEFLQNQKFKFHETINLDGFEFAVNLEDYSPKIDDNVVYLQFNDLYGLTNFYISALNVTPIEKSSIINISLESDSKERAEDFLNVLLTNYLQSVRQEKMTNATKTINFIDSQLGFVSDSLSAIESRLESFKSRNAIDLSNEAKSLYDEIQKLEKEKSAILVKDKYLNYLGEYLQNETVNLEEIVVPSSMGVEDAMINSLVQKLIDFKLEQQSIKNGENMDNPVARRLKNQIESLKKNIIQNIESIKNKNQISLNSINDQIASINSNLQTLPQAEREFVNIDRAHTLSEDLYLFLQQKRAEAGIAKATTTADVKVVNEARIMNNGHPIKPNPMMNYATAFLLGLILPTVLFYVADQLNNKIENEEELVHISSVPILGVVAHESNKQSFLKKGSMNPLAESFRIIRSNIRYLLDNDEKCNTFMVTSSVSGEGKTFCAKHLAYIFAISGKKTLYANTDMRKHNDYREFEIDPNFGLSNYIAKLEEDKVLVHPTKIDNLYILPSGKIPPNPSELLLKDRFKNLMKALKDEFEYIILDTPPIGIIADGMEISKYSDLDIMVVRQNFTNKKDLSYGNQIYKSRKMDKMAIIFNDVKNDRANYRYKGYYNYSKNRNKKESLPKFH